MFAGGSEGLATNVTRSPVKDPSRPKPLSALARAFCENTTAHGFGSFASEEITVCKIFWVAVILGAVVGASCHLWLLLNNYLQYQTQEIVTVSHEPPPFPDVTICNLHAKSRSAWMRAQNETFMMDYFTTMHEIEKAAREAGTWEEIRNWAQAPLSFIESAGRHQAGKVGHQQRDFIVKCTFVGQPCHFEDFTYYVDGDFYNCFTFHNQKTLQNGTAFVGSGPSNSLSLTLYLEARMPGQHDGASQLAYNEYSNVENSVGVRVVVHKRASLTLAVDEGLDASPGHSTSFPVTATYLKRLDKPYDRCSEATFLNGLEQYSYTSTGCLQLCKQQYILRQCGCLSSLLPPFETQASYPLCEVPPCKMSAGYCGTLNASDIKDYFNKTDCEDDKWYEFDSSEKMRVGCQCHTPCRRYKYDVITAQSQWPGDEYVEDFFDNVVLPSDSKAGQQLEAFRHQDSATFANLIRENFARVTVYLQDLEVTSREQTASFVMSSLWSSVGGVLGLWAGVSVITVTECVIFFFKIILACFVGKVKPSYHWVPMQAAGAGSSREKSSSSGS